MSDQLYDFALSSPSTQVERPVAGGWFVTSSGGLYYIRHDMSAVRKAGVGAFNILADDVVLRVNSGEWRQVVSPHLQLRAKKLHNGS